MKTKRGKEKTIIPSKTPASLEEANPWFFTLFLFPYKPGDCEVISGFQKLVSLAEKFKVTTGEGYGNRLTGDI